jgi:undecaprenyl-diphosphatase
MGALQGLGEFLPISSSAHLVLAPWLFRWEDPGLTFDIALHFGTLIAVVIYFWKDWLNLIHKGFTQAGGTEGRLFWLLFFATIPGALVGYLLEHKAETVFRNPVLIAVMLIAMGAVLYWADRRGAKRTELSGIKFGQGMLIGLLQALAIIPGVSRSGITMATALMLGLTREASTRFSFLLSAPIIFGAAAIKVPFIIHNPQVVTIEFITGMAVSCITGLASIGFLLRFVVTNNFLPFAWYRFGLGLIVIIVAFTRG